MATVNGDEAEFAIDLSELPRGARRAVSRAMSEPPMHERYEAACQMLTRSLDRENDLDRAASEVCKYWLDWSQERRDGVRQLSRFLADAIEDLTRVVHDRARAAELRGEQS